MVAVAVGLGGGQGGGAKVGHGLQSGKHLFIKLVRIASFLFREGGREVKTHPPYIIPQELIPSQQTVLPLPSQVAVVLVDDVVLVVVVVVVVGAGVGGQGGGVGLARGLQTSKQL